MPVFRFVITPLGAVIVRNGSGVITHRAAGIAVIGKLMFFLVDHGAAILAFVTMRLGCGSIC